MPNRYRKKAIEVEALQWTGENREEVEAILCDGEEVRPVGSRLEIRKKVTVGTVLYASVGAEDWLIRHPEGALTTCPDQLFEATYEPVGQGERGEVEGNTAEEEREERWAVEDQRDRAEQMVRLARAALGEEGTAADVGAARAALADEIPDLPVLDVEALREKLLERLRAGFAEGNVSEVAFEFDAALSDLEGRDGD